MLHACITYLEAQYRVEMMARRGKKLLVIAGATVTNGPNGEFVTKGPIADYLHQISESFDACTWVANRYQGMDYLAVLDCRKVRVVVVERGWRPRIASWFKMIRLAWEHDHVLYYLPNHFLPIFPLIRLRAKRLAVYLAGDYKFGIQWYAQQRWLGWATLFRWSFEFPMRSADAVIARGKRLARMAAAFNATVHETVPIGHVNSAASCRPNPLPAKASSKAEHHILYVGKIVESKGVGDLLQAFDIIAKRQPGRECFLDLLGEGDDKTKYQALVREWGLDRQVVFHGWISSEAKINAFFSRADLLVVPSTYPEGVPRVIDEAIVRGVPVVATPVGGIGEEFSNDEILLVQEGNPTGLAFGIERMLSDPRVRSHHLEHASRRKELFRNYGSAANQHVRVLLSMV